MDIDNGWNTITANYEYEQLSGAVKVIIPMEMTVQDMGSGEEINVIFPADEDGVCYYAYAGENAKYAATFVLTFEYDEAGGEDAPTTYKINIAENITGGTVSVMDANMIEITEAEAGDFIFLTYEAASGKFCNRSIAAAMYALSGIEKNI
jgi:hypothetical protein